MPAATQSTLRKMPNDSNFQSCRFQTFRKIKCHHSGRHVCPVEGLTSCCGKCKMCNVLAGCLEMLKISATNPRSLVHQKFSRRKSTLPTLSQIPSELAKRHQSIKDRNPKAQRSKRIFARFRVACFLIVPTPRMQLPQPRRSFNFRGVRHIGTPHSSIALRVAAPVQGVIPQPCGSRV